MIEALHLGSMLPATLGACCVAGGADRRSASAWLGMLTMLAAMADTMLLPHPVVPAAAWALALVGVAVATGMRQRLRSRQAHASAAPHTSAMAVHRALQAVLMAGLLVLAAGHRAAGHDLTGSGSAGGTSHAGHGVPVVAVVVAAAVLFAGASVMIAARRGTPLLPRVEALLGGASVALMATALVV